MKKLNALLLVGWKAGGFVSTAVATESPGFAKEFISRVGDLNGDGRLDIFLQEKKPKIVPIALDDMMIPIPLRPDVGEFVLQQNSSGQFDLVSNLTQQAKQAVKQWGIAQAIQSIFKSKGGKGEEESKNKNQVFHGRLCVLYRST